jgi:NADH-quinone oxidoreductase subunit K
MPEIHDYHLLNNSLIVGVLLFVLGVIGFASRRNPVVVLLSVGMMLQGVTITLNSFGAFHGNWSGQVFSIFMLALTVIQGMILLATAISHNHTAEKPHE